MLWGVKIFCRSKGKNGTSITLIKSHLVQFVCHSVGCVVAVGLEGGLSMSRHVQHHKVPALGEVLGHHHPHGLVGTEAMHEEDCQAILGIGRG